MIRRRLCQLTAAILTSDLTTQTQFDGRARGDDVMGNLTFKITR